MNKWVVLIGCVVIAVVAMTLKFAPQIPHKSSEITAAPLPSSQEVSPDMSADVSAPTPVFRSMSPAQATRREAQVSNTHPAQAPQTYVGPDGKEHAIVYNQGLNLDARGVQQMKAEIIKDMRAHPDVFVGLYGLERSDVDDIVAGKKDLPKEMVANLVM